MKPKVARVMYVVVAALIGGGLFGAGMGLGAGLEQDSRNAAAAATTTPPSIGATTVASTSSAAPSPTVSFPPTPDINGTYQGACDYTLGNDPVNGTAVATGDVDVTNTGNITTTYQVTITRPQQGYAPLTMTKSVTIDAGTDNDVQFHMPLTWGQISNLQNWQGGHIGQDGCTYNATATGTSGSAS